VNYWLIKWAHSWRLYWGHINACSYYNGIPSNCTVSPSTEDVLLLVPLLAYTKTTWYEVMTPFWSSKAVTAMRPSLQ